MDADMDKTELEEKFNPKEWLTVEDPLSQPKPETIEERRSLQASESKLRIMEREVEEKNKKWREEQRLMKEKRRAKKAEAKQFTALKERDRARRDRAAQSKKARETKPKTSSYSSKKRGPPTKAKFQFRE
jgi:TolA-binding protein